MGDYTKRFAKAGITTIKAGTTKVQISDIHFAPEDHFLWHPRAKDDPGQDLVDSIVKHGFWEEKPIIVIEVTLPGGKKALYVDDGSRRRNAAMLAEPILRKAGMLAKTDNKLFVPVIIFEGTEAEALAQRVRTDSDPLKRAHTPTVVAQTFVALAKFDWTPKDIAEAHGRISVKDVEALLRFASLPAKTRAAFDNGHLHISNVATYLDMPHAEHAAAIEAAVAAGGATHPRKANKAAKKTQNPYTDKTRAVPVAARTRICEALANGRVKKLKDMETRKEAMVCLRAIQFISGDQAALDAYPAIKEICLEAMARPKKFKNDVTE